MNDKPAPVLHQLSEGASESLGSMATKLMETTAALAKARDVAHRIAGLAIALTDPEFTPECRPRYADHIRAILAEIGMTPDVAGNRRASDKREGEVCQHVYGSTPRSSDRRYCEKCGQPEPSAALSQPKPAGEAGRWTKEPPAKQGRYWHWNGDEDNAPLPMMCLWSGTTRKCFVAMGQFGISGAVDCDVYGGWWMPVAEPRTPEVECHRTDGRFHGRDMTCEHCVIAEKPTPPPEPKTGEGTNE